MYNPSKIDWTIFVTNYSGAADFYDNKVIVFW